MSPVAFSTPQAPKAIGPYSQAAEGAGLVFVSGQIPLKADGSLEQGSIAAQADRCLSNIEAILKAAGLGLEDVVRLTVYMTDLGQFAAMNEAYAKRFKDPYPARAAVQVAALPKGVPIEIDAIAARKG